MKTLSILLFLLLSSTLADQVPIDVQQVIKNATNINDRRLVDYYAACVKKGYASNPKLTEVKIGKPIHLQVIDGDTLKKLGENAQVSSVLKPLNEWAVPLLLNNRVLVMLRISKNPFNPKWHVSGYGAGGIAKQWERICRVWPQTAGYHPILIGNLKGPCYFEIPEKGDNNLSPLMQGGSQKNNIDSVYKSLDSSKVMLKEIKFRMSLLHKSLFR